MYKRMLVGKTHFHMKGFTQRLILTQKQKGNLKMAFWICVKKELKTELKYKIMLDQILLMLGSKGCFGWEAFPLSVV